jgi:dephospho-CoA kinase
MNSGNDPCVAQASREAAGGKQQGCVGDKESPSIKKPLIIGITGGMASGKSTIARMLSGRGIAHVDADKLVHQLLQHDRATVAQIAAAFPAAKKGHAIDRAALASHIAKHPEALAILESILHPRVRATEEEAIAIARRNGLRALVLDIPLLFETDADQLCDIVIVAHAKLHHRRRRAFTRAGMSEAKWQRLIDRQLPYHHRNALADIVIRTDMGKAAVKKQVKALMRAWGLL